ncbi:hypothetical protein HQ563_18250 [bacterium]|nr:hypothetical protein [bacterium]
MFTRNVCFLLLLGLSLTPGPDCAQAQNMVWLGRPIPETAIPADEASTLFRELVLPEVSGKELAKHTQAFNLRWEGHLAERENMASALTELAAEYEKKQQFAKALALCEKVWEVFPEQQDLIGKIKRDRALGEVEIDLSTPQSAFTSLKRALLTYKLTAATFGLVEPSTVLYQPSRPRERHEDDDILENLKRRIEQHKEEVEKGILPDGLEPTPFPSLADLPAEPEPPPFHTSAEYLMDAHLVDFYVEDTTPAQALEKLLKLSSIPFVFTHAARTYVKELSTGDQKGATNVRMNLKGVPVDEALLYLLRNHLPELDYFQGPFAAHIYNRDRDRTEPFFTLVRQNGPGVRSPDRMKSFADDFPDDSSESFAEFMVQAMGLEQLPEGWLVYGSAGAEIEVITGPRCLHDVVGFPGFKRYSGRVLPLFRCLMPYPFPQNPGERYDEPKERYLCHYQVDWQDYRMQGFLNDRGTIVMLLRSKLVKAEQRVPNRYIPEFDVPERTISLTSRLGLWFDGKAYRFLLFDSEEDRERWLKGGDWLDMPSDIDNYDWESEEELQDQPTLTSQSPPRNPRSLMASASCSPPLAHSRELNTLRIFTRTK